MSRKQPRRILTVPVAERGREGGSLRGRGSGPTSVAEIETGTGTGTETGGIATGTGGGETGTETGTMETGGETETGTVGMTVTGGLHARGRGECFAFSAVLALQMRCVCFYICTMLRAFAI